MTDVHADINAIRQLRATVVGFRYEQAGVLAEASNEIQATQASLEAKAARWRSELERRQAALQECQAAAAAAAAAPPHVPHGYVDCSRLAWAVDEAVERLENVRAWQTQVDQAVQLYRGAADRFRGRVEGEIPRTVAHLESLVRALQAARGLQV